MMVIAPQQDLDLSLPVSTILRDGTYEIHEAVRNSQGSGWLIRGELDVDEYVRYLMMLWHIYDTLEEALERHASHPTLQPTYNPTLLARAPNLASDISSLLQVHLSDWKEHPLHTSLLSSPPEPFADYISRLRVLANSTDPSLLLAHAYIRYLGDLSGGQIMRHRIVKAYDIDPAEGGGATYYDFKYLGGSRSASFGDMKRIKEWYKQGMDAGVGRNKELKCELLQEAKLTFEFNNGMFSCLKEPSNKITHANDKPGSNEAIIQVGHGRSQEQMGTLVTRDYGKLAALKLRFSGVFQTS